MSHQTVGIRQPVQVLAGPFAQSTPAFNVHGRGHHLTPQVVPASGYEATESKTSFADGDGTASWTRRADAKSDPPPRRRFRRTVGPQRGGFLQ